MKTNLIITLLILAVFLLMPGCNQQKHTIYKSNGRIDYPLTADEEIMLDSIQQKTFQFFMMKHHPEWGIVKDRTAAWAPASIASTGFGLPSFAIGAERGWITRDEAARITVNTLDFLVNSVQSADTAVTGYKGFYYHFLRMSTGTR